MLGSDHTQWDIDKGCVYKCSSKKKEELMPKCSEDVLAAWGGSTLD